MSDIYVPRSVIQQITYIHDKKQLTNPCVCVRFERKGYEVSLSMDSSLGPGDLKRAEIRIYKNNVDVTNDFMFLFQNAGIIVGNIDNLMACLNHIDSLK
jgi:hypothetical protein